MIMIMNYKHLQHILYPTAHKLFGFQISMLPFMEDSILSCVGSTVENLHRQCCVTAIPLGALVNCDAYFMRNTNKQLERKTNSEIL